MKDDRNDEMISALFQELRAAEGAWAPAFAHVWARAEVQMGQRRRAARAFRVVLALGAVAAAIALLVVGAREFGGARVPGRSAGEPLAAVIALSDWRSPTQSLLDFPGYDLLRAPPRIAVTLPGVPALEARPEN